MSLQTVMNFTTIAMPPHYHTSASANSVSGLAQSIFSYDGNVMLAALVSLLVVILFVLILHLYAKWFLVQARTRRQTSNVLGPARFTHRLSDSLPFFHYAITSVDSSCATKGLDPCVLSDIPLFVYESEKKQVSGSNGLECVICLTAFEESEIGRSLTKCKHAFHVDCIDMWLSSHTNCPICRAAVVSEAVCSESKAIMDQEVIVSDHHDEFSRSSSTGNGENELESIMVENHGQYQTGHDHQVNTDTGMNDINNDSSITTATASSDSLPSTYFGCSLKRMLSLSRHHRSESKVFPSSNAVDQLDAN